MVLKKVIKRDGKTEVYNREKLLNAVERAFKNTKQQFTDKFKEQFIEEIEKMENTAPESMCIEDIQDFIENFLIKKNKYEVVKSYILYRDKRSRVREQKSKLMKGIKEKLEAKNVQNQNANVDEKSFGGRMGEVTRVITKDIALYDCMSEVSRENHLNNEIYIHDLDSYAVAMHNCFDANTKFITDRGVKKFSDCVDGQIVNVVDKDGNWRKATVKSYGKQKMYKLTFKSDSIEKTVVCTRDHRWVLEDGTVTTNICVGDSLYMAKPINQHYEIDDFLWCFGFAIGNECDFSMESKDKTNSDMTVRLCGNKTEYINRFLNSGWSIKEKHENGDVILLLGYNVSHKNTFLKNKLWRVLSYNYICNVFDGYIHANEHFNENGSITVSTTDKNIKKFIEEVSSVYGYYLWAENSRDLFYLCKEQSTKWTLIDIKADRSGDNGYKVAWCVEEPKTNTFTLDGGMVTGNCLSVPFDSLLATGFKIRQTDIRPARSVNTAMQLVAVLFQIQSLQQFGGVSATHLDWTMVPYVRMSFHKHFKNGLKYCENVEDWKYDGNIAELSIEDEIYKKHDKAYKYALDLTENEVKQAAEGLFHNLNSLTSRSGNQLPFTSINFGTCTLPEGRMIIKYLLTVSLEGLGKFGRTSIFPCGIFQCKTGVNRHKGDPNYDMFLLALESTSQRIYPNYCNCDTTMNDAVEGEIKIKQEVLDSLSDKEYDKLYNMLKENPKLSEILKLEIE